MMQFCIQVLVASSEPLGLGNSKGSRVNEACYALQGLSPRDSFKLLGRICGSGQSSGYRFLEEIWQKTLTETVIQSWKKSPTTVNEKTIFASNNNLMTQLSGMLGNGQPTLLKQICCNDSFLSRIGPIVILLGLRVRVLQANQLDEAIELWTKMEKNTVVKSWFQSHKDALEIWNESKQWGEGARREQQIRGSKQWQPAAAVAAASFGANASIKSAEAMLSSDFEVGGVPLPSILFGCVEVPSIDIEVGGALSTDMEEEARKDPPPQHQEALQLWSLNTSTDLNTDGHP